MASAPESTSSLKDDLKRLLHTEAGRRQRFVVQLLDTAVRLNEKKTPTEQNGEDTSVDGLVSQIQRTDTILQPLLLLCQGLCLEEGRVDSRKEDQEDSYPIGCHRDSGFSSSTDVGAMKRQAMFVPITDVRGGDGPEAIRGVQQPSNGQRTEDIRKGVQAGIATQHTDESSDAESGSSLHSN